MKWMADIDIKPLHTPITHQHKVILMGSCFTEHIGGSLEALKFNVLQNPNGILFETESVCRSLEFYIRNERFTAADLIEWNGLWMSWQHHSRFSSPDQEACLQQINSSFAQAHSFLKEADWLLITLGSSFVYRLQENREFVANCHKAPGQWFEKYLIPVDEQISRVDNVIHQLFHFNPKLKILFTISPVRHLRDGVVDNNRSKARLIETVHHLVNKFERLFYFPAYELVIDVLRDYRFYDIDLAHPNYAATQFVMERFSEYAFDEPTRQLNKQLRQLITARNHKPFHAGSEQHRQFRVQQLKLTQELASRHPELDLTDLLTYFA